MSSRDSHATIPGPTPPRARPRVLILDPWLHVAGGGERYVCSVAEALAEDHEVVLAGTLPVAREMLEERLHLNLDRVRITRTGRHTLAEARLRRYWASWQEQRSFDLVFHLVSRYVDIPFGRRNVLLLQMPLTGLPGKARRLRETWFRRKLRTYDLILANSLFTLDHLRRVWGITGELLYPPVASIPTPPGRKRGMILAVGRFFTRPQDKKHEVLVDAFTAMVREGLSGWEFQIAGGLEAGPEFARRFRELEMRIAGYPIAMHPNISFDGLSLLYGQAAIFWHAAGSGEDPTAHPERFEHFGISTVEAMSAGCVPVVFAGGGQTEIVSHGETGLLWSSPTELQAHTWRLIRDSAMTAGLALRARKASARFTYLLFAERLRVIVDRIMAVAARGTRQTAASRGAAQHLSGTWRGDRP